mmetsp:Transcript_23972/g.80864  ORF Transcript_23972/g.80864 Transcript_23972/m.80864 type:complete len:287 (+) Transcript_23972:525-1385(+)
MVRSRPSLEARVRPHGGGAGVCGESGLGRVRAAVFLDGRSRESVSQVVLQLLQRRRPSRQHRPESALQLRRAAAWDFGQLPQRLYEHLGARDSPGRAVADECGKGKSVDDCAFVRRRRSNHNRRHRPRRSRRAVRTPRGRNAPAQQPRAQQREPYAEHGAAREPLQKRGRDVARRRRPVERARDPPPRVLVVRRVERCLCLCLHFGPAPAELVGVNRLRRRGVWLVPDFVWAPTRRRRPFLARQRRRGRFSRRWRRNSANRRAELEQHALGRPRDAVCDLAQVCRV